MEYVKRWAEMDILKGILLKNLSTYTTEQKCWGQTYIYIIIFIMASINRNEY